MVDEEGKDREPPKPTPPETPPPIISQIRTRGESRQWIMLFIYMLIALIVAAGVVLGGRWVYNQVRDNEPAKETATTTDKAPEAPSTSSNQTGASSEEDSDQFTPAPPGTSSLDRELADTGPGEVIALFIGSTVVAMGLHYIVNLRRSAG